MSNRRKITRAFENTSLRSALRYILELGRLGNRFFQEQEPWVKIKQNKKAVEAVMSALVHLVKDLAIVLSPVMPDLTKRLAKMLNYHQLTWDKLGNFKLLDKPLDKGEILFEKLDKQFIEQCKTQFGLKQTSRWDKVNIKVGKF